MSFMFRAIGRWIPIAGILLALSVSVTADAADRNFKHVRVYYETGRFGGWPANHGLWSWGDEILVGFGRGYHKDLGNSHNIDREKPEDHLLARSLDGGETWAIEDPSKNGALIPADSHLFGIPRPGLKIPTAVECPGGIDFTHPDFAMTLRMFCKQPGGSQMSYSYDRGKHWKGPFALPNCGTPGTEARSNYLVNGKHDCTPFLSTIGMSLPEGKGTGKRSFCVRTRDGGKTWDFLSWIGPPLEGNAIMPAVARAESGDLVSVVRRRKGSRRWLTAYASGDEGQTWVHTQDPSDDTGYGNPASVIALEDGRICLTYGHRSPPYRMCAKLSDDAGRTWSDEIVLRDDGGSRDLGYPRSMQRTDGKVVTVYYFWDKKTGPERYIAATIWDPAKVP
jgi:hypothetical protein